MNTVITSKAAIMQVCREIVAKNGLKSLNMRLVAKECHIALGTLYNYYADKDALVLATVESIWLEIFHSKTQQKADVSFPGYVANLYANIQKGAESYPNFLTGHSLAIASTKRVEARSIMGQTFSHMRDGMLEALQADPALKKDAFSPALSEEAFVGFVLDNVLVLLVQGKEDCTVLLEIIRKVIYRQ